ncbi:Type II/IV secretion system protein [Geodermatophilus siccatus]|uniref:Type II/IV secretion system protein n=1 Tax=Geodermatophilus siccatus TaxID=1137991 RepID=A0A1G9PSV8_9ACTN|nr:ATPase, T2SS/T4P/T4SS family [Geodermatophilus siccatus]SDM01799.1 Type II/IV secretion system protein [Geodermatophilus siccatus]
MPLPDVVAMQTRQPNLEGAGEIPLRRLVKEALRMRPSRIVVGEVRQEECLDLLIALNSGLPGIYLGAWRACHHVTAEARTSSPDQRPCASLSSASGSAGRWPSYAKAGQ